MNANGGKAMTEFSRASNMIADGSPIGSATDTRGPDPVQKSRRRESGLACATMALAAFLLMGASVQALAQTPGHVWAGCELSATAVDQLETTLDDAGIIDPEVAFVVVYSLNNDNDGQQVAGGFTGPVICRNNDVVSAPTPTTQTNDIGSASATVTVLDGEEAFLLRYQFEGEEEENDIEKRVCHTVDSETDCFLIVPAEEIP
jgi:hypothetical protein